MARGGEGRRARADGLGFPSRAPDPAMGAFSPHHGFDDGQRRAGWRSGMGILCYLG